MNSTVDEAVIDARKLEQDIAAKIKAFQDKYKLEVVQVGVTQARQIQGNLFPFVELDVKLRG